MQDRHAEQTESPTHHRFAVDWLVAAAPNALTLHADTSDSNYRLRQALDWPHLAPPTYDTRFEWSLSAAEFLRVDPDRIAG
ncbi:Uncharacterised protein [Vibrio cholerae]|uniref:Uncharacterized protein n=1 Tax=Vibrio cholerae TaxID=666 RepID=A0A655S977_VIBCL|nr:Uncharacterised protein [Vibrio cholerae]CSB19996.1 Uncharacterised protein [Vibrio cholerae]CSB30361.1 Uncharacterised protein [Vibrio cholerae]CSB39393.1 Uncharacterised protein [Vibrio cholerae]CSC04243.1 Uncharacterised protein [Vibrio cholerae]